MVGGICANIDRFCKIVAGDIPADKIYEDENVFAFHDIGAQAPHHFLVVPKTHVTTLNDVNDETLIGKLSLTAIKIAKDLGFSDDGYRLVMNCNKQGGQSVYHVHLHCLGGRQLTWPPG